MDRNPLGSGTWPAEHLVYSDNLSAEDRALVYGELFSRYAIPEPGAAALLSVTGAALLGTRRRRGSF